MEAILAKLESHVIKRDGELFLSIENFFYCNRLVFGWPVQQMLVPPNAKRDSPPPLFLWQRFITCRWIYHMRVFRLRNS